MELVVISMEHRLHNPNDLDIQTRTGQRGSLARHQKSPTDPSQGQETDGREEDPESSEADEPEITSSSSSSSSSTSSEHAMAVPDERSISQQQNSYMNLRRKCHEKISNVERSSIKRQKSRDLCRPLKQWLYSHRDTPYPSRTEKMELSVQSNLTLTQVSNWFANARRRLKNTVSGPPGITWSRRMKLYNRHVVGNQELLSISSDGDSSSRDLVEEEEEEGGGDDDGDGEKGVKTGSCNRDDGVGSPRRNEECSSKQQQAFLRCIRPGETDHHFFPDSSTAARPSIGACPISAKVKQGIIQRYLNDTTMSIGIEVGQQSKAIVAPCLGRDSSSSLKHHQTVGVETLFLRDLDFRHRNASGSLSSHDYEELSVSSRSTPIKDQCFNDEDHPYGNSGKDFHWKEISAALGLTLLANCVQKTPNESF